MNVPIPAEALARATRPGHAKSVMDEKDAAELADWAEHELALKSNSPTALRGAAAGKYGQATIECALDEHLPAEPDREQLSVQFDRARRGIAGKE